MFQVAVGRLQTTADSSGAHHATRFSVLVGQRSVQGAVVIHRLVSCAGVVKQLLMFSVFVVDVGQFLAA